MPGAMLKAGCLEVPELRSIGRGAQAVDWRRSISNCQATAHKGSAGWQRTIEGQTHSRSLRPKTWGNPAPV